MCTLIYIMDNKEIEGIKSMLNNEEYEDEIYCGLYKENIQFIQRLSTKYV